MLADLDARLYYSYGFVLYAASSLLANPYLLLKRRQQLGMSGGLMQTWSSEGLCSLFRGGSLCWISGSNRMAYFTIYEHVSNVLEHIHETSSFKTFSRRNNDILQSMSTGVAAAVASVTSQVVLTPFSVITTRLHVNTGPPVSSLQVLSSVVQSHGSWRVLWTGYTSALLQSIPHNLVMFSVYNFSKAQLRSWGCMDSGVTDVAARLLCSVLGSYAAILVTSPIDITRTHRQAMLSVDPCTQISGTGASLGACAGGGEPGVLGGRGASTSVIARRRTTAVPSSWLVFADLYSRHGVRFLWRGSGARLLSSTPYTVAMLIGYDYVKLYATKTATP